MSLLYFAPPVSPLKKNTSLNPKHGYVYCNHICGDTSITRNLHTSLKYRTPNTPLFITRGFMSPNAETSSENMEDFEFGDDGQGDIEDTESPWEGAVVYKRNSFVTHVEYCTTLERLGLGKHSTEVSKSRASIMGIRVTKAVKEYPFGTPVQISVDVTRKKHKLRLDGIIRTVLTLGCNRCGEAAAECVFSNFSLLLCEEPIEESNVINMGVIFGEEKSKSSTGSSDERNIDDDSEYASIDLDDRLYFPPKEGEIDISKHIRDMVHVEISISAVCDPKCKGMCLNCGMNLNTSSCSCSTKHGFEEKGQGPLGNLRKQMQQSDAI